MKYVSTTGVVALEDIVGKSLVRQSREGMMLKASDVAAPQLIGKNDPVTIFFKHGPMTLTVKGQAVTSAPAGGTIQVLNLLSKRVITATAISSGAVQVTATTLAVAGL
jgi:flagella basal body P-ring formation protein FlgA